MSEKKKEFFVERERERKFPPREEKDHEGNLR